MANPISVPGTVVPSGAAISPGGAQGVQGLAGPSKVSTDANNKAILGSDSLVLVQGTAAGVAATTHAQTVSGDDPRLAIATATTSGLVPTPPNNTTTFLRGDATWAAPGGGGGGGTKTMARFTALDNHPPISAFATFDVRTTGVAVLDFPNATDNSAVFLSSLPEAATLTTGLQIYVAWASVTATTGNVEWQASLDNITSHSIDTDSYGTGVSVVTATSGTAALPQTTTISLPNANLQSLAIGQGFKLKITRRGSDTTNDTMADTAALILVEVRAY